MYSDRAEGQKGEIMMLKKALLGLTLAAALAGAAAAADLIGEERAVGAAVAHAGVDRTQAQVIEFGLREMMGTAIYDVKFVAGGVKYEYRIDAQSGSVVGYEREGTPAPAPAPTPTAAPQTIDMERARQIALSHAGVDQSRVYDMKVEQDFEHGRAVYEVEFKAGGYEYDYEIDAATGRVLKSHREWD